MKPNEWMVAFFSNGRQLDHEGAEASPLNKYDADYGNAG
jgi:hypothetical protein